MKKTSLLFFVSVLFFLGFAPFSASAQTEWLYFSASGVQMDGSYSSEPACEYVMNTQFGGVGHCAQETCGALCVPGSECSSRTVSVSGTCRSTHSCCEPIDWTCSQAGGTCVHSANCPTGHDVAAGGVCAGGYTCCKPATSQACVGDLTSSNGTCYATCPSGSSAEGQGDCPDEQYCCVGSISLDCTSDSGVSGTCSDTCPPGSSGDGQGTCVPGLECCVEGSYGGGGCSSRGGSCQPTGCDANTHTQQGTCTTANDGAANDGYFCCVPNSSVSGSCSSKGGSCEATGCDANTHTQQGTCTTANDGAANDGYFCCVPNDSSSGGGFPPASGSSAFTFPNPLRYDTVQEVLGAALTALRNVIVLLALVFLVLGAVLYIVSSGNEKTLGTAKKMILAAMIGLALGIAAPSFLKEIAEILNWGGEVPTEVQQAQTLSEIAENLLNFLLSMVGILGIVMIVVGGLMYFAAAGDEKRADTAKKIILYSIIGVAVALTALIIVRTIASLFVAS